MLLGLLLFYEYIFLFLDDLHDARANITELTRRLHELEIELRRLENEREELTAAYKEAEAVSHSQTHFKYCSLFIIMYTLKHINIFHVRNYQIH